MFSVCFESTRPFTSPRDKGWTSIDVLKALKFRAEPQDSSLSNSCVSFCRHVTDHSSYACDSGQGPFIGVHFVSSRSAAIAYEPTE